MFAVAVFAFLAVASDAPALEFPEVDAYATMATQLVDALSQSNHAAVVALRDAFYDRTDDVDTLFRQVRLRIDASLRAPGGRVDGASADSKEAVHLLRSAVMQHASAVIAVGYYCQDNDEELRDAAVAALTNAVPLTLEADALAKPTYDGLATKTLPPCLDLEASAARYASAGEVLRIRCRIANAGDISARNVRVKLTKSYSGGAPAEFVDLGQLAAGREMLHVFNVRLPSVQRVGLAVSVESSNTAGRGKVLGVEIR